MRDLFDEFMEELRRRQAQAGSGAPDGRAPTDARRVGPDDESDAADAPDASDPTEATGEEAPDGARPSPASDDTPDERPAEEPIGFDRRRTAGRTGRPGGPRGRPPRPTRVGGPDDGGRRPSLRGLGLGIVALVLLAVFSLATVGLEFWTDAIWFKSVGFDAVFWTRVSTQAALFLGVGALALVFLLANLWLASRLAPPPDGDSTSPLRTWWDRLSEAGPRPGPEGPWTSRRPDGPPVRPAVAFEMGDLPDFTPLARWGLAALAVLIALGTAGAAAANWETILLWRNQVPFSPAGVAAVTDPIFGKDVGFYLFELPFLRYVQGTINGLLIAGLLVAGGRYLLGGMRGSASFTTPMRFHLAVLGGLYLLSTAWGYQLDKLSLVYSTQGIATGVSYTDQNARFLAYDALTAISAFAGAFLVGGAFTRQMWPLGAAIAVWLSASFVLGGLYPAAIQRFAVEPDQLGKEAPYIRNNVAMTRVAYDLNAWKDISYDGTQPLTAQTVAQEQGTFQNARLWDYRPLRDALDQIQTVRQYYDFTDVDTDRYPLLGVDRQVMLSARELAPEKNPQADSWVNQKITFTHGIGVAMVPVNEATEGGQPQLVIRDLPPVSSAGAPTIKEPRIYFGERPSDWVITGARQSEFDYPVGQAADGSTTANATTRWTGSTGIRLDTTLSRLLFALRFKDLNLLISDQITSDTQLLMHRSLSDRLPRIAPFLRFDKDPYLVVTPDGRLVYVQDAYTISDRFPNAEPFDTGLLSATSGLAGDSFNYIRNSVKVVEDAYTGEMTFYVSDPSDPIIRTYQAIFPTLFKPLDSMSADLRAHLRVPEERFNIQARTFARYHVTDPAAFYNNEDLWTVPTDPGGTQSLPNEAYYVVMRMPGEPASEFLLLQPMVPAKRPNMIAWIAARNDGADYGAVRVYRFPQDTSILGPNQIQAKIDADPVISAQTTLWDASGSHVIRGNLIVVPIQNSLIYLQPVYLQSQNSAFPEFQRIVVATSSRVVWANTLSGALELLLAGGAGPGPSPSPGPTASPGPSVSPGPSASPLTTPPPTDVAALIADANLHFERAQAALRAGDFATYGSEIARVQADLSQLDALVSGSPAPSATP